MSGLGAGVEILGYETQKQSKSRSGNERRCGQQRRRFFVKKTGLSSVWPNNGIVAVFTP